MPASELEPLYLLTGNDLPRLEVAIRRLRAHFEHGSIEHLFADTSTGSDAVAAANALGLFGDGERLVLVERVEQWRKQDVAAVAAYAAAPTPGAVLALVGDPARLPAGLEAVFERAGSIVRLDVPTRQQRGKEVADFPRWVQGQFERARTPVGREVAERLVALVGENAFALQSEIDKLVAWAGGGAIEPEDVEALVVPEREVSRFELGDAWGARSLARALEVCEAMLVEDEPFLVAARLADHVSRVRSVQRLVEQDLGQKEIAQRLSLHPFRVQRAAQQAANYAGAELDGAVVRLAALDHALKGGSRVDPQLELERALVEITRQPEARSG